MRNILPVFLIIASFITLIALGSWQVQRLAWKTNIIHKLDIAYAQEPAQNILSFKDLKISEDDMPILYGSVKGRFDYSKEIFVGPKPLEGEIGYQVITPLKINSGGYILVNRGWINQNQRDMVAQSHVQGSITMSGIFRKTDWNSFTPNNSPKNNVWTKLDIKEIAREKEITPVAPLMLFAEKSSKDFKVLTIQSAKWYPRNKHQQYALFWFTMAGVLLIVFGLYWHNHKKS